jgi:hypothetical protein
LLVFYFVATVTGMSPDLVARRLHIVRHHARVAASLERAADRQDAGRSTATEGRARSRLARARAADRRRRAAALLTTIRSDLR